MIGADLGIDAAVLRARYLRLQPEPGIDSQKRLLVELRRRVALEAAVGDLRVEAAE